MTAIKITWGTHCLNCQAYGLEVEAFYRHKAWRWLVRDPIHHGVLVATSPQEYSRLTAAKHAALLCAKRIAVSDAAPSLWVVLSVSGKAYGRDILVYRDARGGSWDWQSTDQVGMDHGSGCAYQSMPAAQSAALHWARERVKKGNKKC
jgi:hypothetical protein